MKRTNSYPISLYAAVCVATFCLWMGEDDPWPYPWVVVLFAIAAAAFTDHWNVLVLPRWVPVLAGASALVFFIRDEARSLLADPPDFALPLGHLFVWCQVILFFHRKAPRFYWYMILMSFLEMVIAALHSNQLAFGVMTAAYLMLMLWTLTRFNSARMAERTAMRVATEAPLAPARRSVIATIATCVAVLLVGLFFFLVIPRQGASAWTHSQYRSGQYLSGFDDRIQLGQLGTILESDDEVMTVHLFDEASRPYRPRGEPLWRGVIMSHYEAGRWERRADLQPAKASPWFPRDAGASPTPEQFIRQEISLKMAHREVVFALRPCFKGNTRNGDLLAMTRLDGTIARPDNVSSGPLQYTIHSYLDASSPQPQEYLLTRVLGDPIHRRLLDQYGQVPDTLVEPLREYVAQLKLPPTNERAVLTAALMNHLQDPAIFDYTLNASVVDRSIDPVLDFLINRKEGHCEYFASALALLLRAHGVPARVVNGFKGGDWNELVGQFVVVRQKHAHSWVEAVMVTREQPQPHWLTLDPTPGQSRQRAVAQVSRTPAVWRELRDMSRQMWTTYVLNFNSGEQEAAIYGPVRMQAQALVGFVRGTAGESGGGFNWVAAVLASGVVAVLIFVSRTVIRRFRIWKFVWAENGQERPPGLLGLVAEKLRQLLMYWSRAPVLARPRVAFYDQLVQTLARHGVHKRPAATPLQYADEAAEELELAAPLAAVAKVPPAIVQRFYRVRFGGDTLSPHESNEIDVMLRTLTEALAKRSKH